MTPAMPRRFYWDGKTPGPRPPAREGPAPLSEEEQRWITHAAIRRAGEKGLSPEELAKILEDLDDAIVGYMLVCGLLSETFSVGIDDDGEVAWCSGTADEENSG
jgi:hypothetical protein